MRGDTPLIARFNRTCERFDDGQARASLAGKELNGWKCEKPLLIAEVERGRQLLQMTLGLNDTNAKIPMQALP
ncbi:ORF11CD3 domain protein [compost metagenome]